MCLKVSYVDRAVGMGVFGGALFPSTYYLRELTRGAAMGLQPASVGWEEM